MQEKKSNRRTNVLSRPVGNAKNDYSFDNSISKTDENVNTKSKKSDWITKEKQPTSPSLNAKAESSTSETLPRIKTVSTNSISETDENVNTKSKKSDKKFANTVKDINNNYKKYNLVVSLFSAKDNYIKNLISKEGVKIEYKKEGLSQVNPQLYEWLGTVNEKPSVANSISETDENVNTKSKKSDKKFALPENVEEEVLSHYGKTYNWNETGYLLKNGTRLDLSGRNDGASGSYRTVDHRDIFDIFEDGESYGSEAMVEFMDANNNPAPMVVYSKKINGTYYIGQAVPDSSYKKLWVVSAYIQKESVAQALNTKKKSSVGTSLVSPDSTNSISKTDENVNTKSKKSDWITKEKQHTSPSSDDKTSNLTSKTERRLDTVSANSIFETDENVNIILNWAM